MKCFTSFNSNASILNKTEYVFLDMYILYNEQYPSLILKKLENYELFHCYPFYVIHIARKDINRKVFRIKPSQANNIFLHL